MASFKETAIDLVLRAKNFISKETEAAAESIELLSTESDELNKKLRKLEDQKRLAKEFDKASKSVDRAGKEFNAASKKVEKFEAKIKKAGPATEAQHKELNELKEAADKSSTKLANVTDELEELETAAKGAGVNTGKLEKEQRELGDELVETSRAVKDNKEELAKQKAKLREAGDATEKYGKKVGTATDKIDAFGRKIKTGISSFLKWGAAATAAVGTLSTIALARFTTATADQARQTLASAEAFGIGVVQLQEFKAAAEQAGIGGEKAADILKDVAEKIGDAFLNDAGEAKEVLQGLGLDLDVLVKMRPDEQIKKIGGALNGLPRAGQIQILEALANDASLLIPLLENNSARLKEFAKLAQDRGAILEEGELEDLAAADLAFEKLILRVKGFGLELAAKLAPAWQGLAESIDGALSDKPELVDKITTALRNTIDATAEWVAGLQGSDIEGTFKTIENSARRTGSVLGIVGNGVMTVSGTLVEFGLRTSYSIGKATVALLKLGKIAGLVSDEALEAAETRLGGLGAAVQAVDEKTDAYAESTRSAFAQLSDSFASTAESAEAAGESVGELTEEVDQWADAGKRAGAGADAATIGIADLAGSASAASADIDALTVSLEAAKQVFNETGSSEAAAQVEALRIQLGAAKVAQLGMTEAQASGIGTIISTTEATASLNSALGQTADQYVENREEAEAAAKAQQKAAKEAGDATQEVADTAVAASGKAGAAIGRIFDGFTSRLASLSSKAIGAFNATISGSEVATDALTRGYENAANLLEYTTQRIRNVGVAGLLNDWATSAFKTEKAFYGQAIAARDMAEALEAGDRSALLLSSSTEELTRRFDLLDERQLAPLINAISAAKREMDSLNGSLQDTIESARVELAGLEGDTLEVERLRYESDRAELQRQLAQAEATGNKEGTVKAKEALEITKKIYDTRIAQYNASKADRAAERAAEEARRTRGDEREERQDIQRDNRRDIENAASTQRTNPTVRTVRLEFTNGGNNLGSIDALDDGGIDQLIRALERAGFVVGG